MIRLFAPAKINLSLEVLGKRADGYHEVRTVLQAIDLADEVLIEPSEINISLRIEPAGALSVEGNLVLRAADALREETGVSAGAGIVLRKRIPVAAGLGGGSSDAAATLLGLRKLWEVDRDKAAAYRVATSLGADVPFFLRGGTALGSGRGDALELLGLPIERFAVVVTPPEAQDPSKTARLYGMLRPEHFSDGSRTAEVARRIASGRPLGDAMSNTFDAVAGQAYRRYHEACSIVRAASTRRAAREKRVLLAGAGPSVFTLVDDRDEGDAIAAEAHEQGYEAHVARLLGPWSSDGLRELP